MLMKQEYSCVLSVLYTLKYTVPFFLGYTSPTSEEDLNKSVQGIPDMSNRERPPPSWVMTTDGWNIQFPHLDTWATDSCGVAQWVSAVYACLS